MTSLLASGSTGMMASALLVSGQPSAQGIQASAEKIRMMGSPKNQNGVQTGLNNCLQSLRASSIGSASDSGFSPGKNVALVAVAIGFGLNTITEMSVNSVSRCQLFASDIWAALVLP